MERRLRTEERRLSSGTPQKEEALAHWKYQRYIKDYLRCVASLDETFPPAARLPRRERPVEKYGGDFLRPTGILPGGPWLVRQAVHVRRGVSPAALSPLARRRQSGHPLHFAWSRTSTSPKRSWKSPGCRGRGICRDKVWSPSWAGRQRRQLRKSLYYEYYDYPAVHMVNKHEGVRTDRYKLLHFYELGEWELYDLQNDSHEMHSVLRRYSGLRGRGARHETNSHACARSTRCPQPARPSPGNRGHGPNRMDTLSGICVDSRSSLLTSRPSPHDRAAGLTPAVFPPCFSNAIRGR